MSFPEPVQWGVFAGLAALVALDSGPFLLSMLGRPLPAAALLGLAWGDPGGGALVGATLELVYAGILPVGAVRYPEAGLAGLVGAGVALCSARALGAPSLLLGLVCGLLAGQAGKGMETWRRAQNAVRVAQARAAAQAGDASALSRVIVEGLLFAAVVGAGAAVGLLGLGLLLAAPLVDIAPDTLSVRLPLVLFAALGCGTVLRLWGARAVRVTLAGGLGVGLLIGLLVAGAESA